MGIRLAVPATPAFFVLFICLILYFLLCDNGFADADPRRQSGLITFQDGCLPMIDISRIPVTEPVRIIIGAGEQRWPGWIATHRETLDLLQPEDWAASFGQRLVDAFLCEHVWEHLTETEGRAAARLCYRWLKPGGYLRCAVPDANFPDAAYQRIARIGGPGPKDHPAADHKIVYDYRCFSDVFVQAGFAVDLLEYCDEQGRFHYHQWSPDQGPIYRSLRLDHRNKEAEIRSVSLIIDARKPD
jgi:predicted SAM-dependent methyltransferase